MAQNVLYMSALKATQHRAVHLNQKLGFQPSRRVRLSLGPAPAHRVDLVDEHDRVLRLSSHREEGFYEALVSREGKPATILHDDFPPKPRRWRRKSLEPFPENPKP